jgi:DNA-binding transcriptional LysR family regulator
VKLTASGEALLDRARRTLHRMEEVRVVRSPGNFAAWHAPGFGIVRARKRKTAI